MFPYDKLRNVEELPLFQTKTFQVDPCSGTSHYLSPGGRGRGRGDGWSEDSGCVTMEFSWFPIPPWGSVIFLWPPPPTSRIHWQFPPPFPWKLCDPQNPPNLGPFQAINNDWTLAVSPFFSSFRFVFFFLFLKLHNVLDLILKFAGNVSLTELSFLRVDPMDDFLLFGSCEWHVFFFSRWGRGERNEVPSGDVFHCVGEETGLEVLVLSYVDTSLCMKFLRQWN